MSRPGTALLFGIIANLFVFSGIAVSDELNSEEIRTLFAGKTAKCIKTKDFSTCDTYMGEDGSVKRLTFKDGKIRLGTWEANNKNQLCITWEGRKRALCFIVIENRNGTHRLVKRNKTKSVIAGFEDGDTISKQK